MWDYDGDGQGDCNLNYDANGGIVGIDQNGDTVLDYDPSLDQDGDCIPDNLNSSNCNWTILWGQMWDYDGDGQGDCNLNFDANGGIVGIDQNGDTILDYDPNLDLNGNCIPDSVE